MIGKKTLRGERRNFLRALSGLAVLGLANPRYVWAALAEGVFDQAFAARQASEVFRLLGAQSDSNSAELTIKAPDVAENGALVPVDIASEKPLEFLAVIGEKNPLPLIAVLEFGQTAPPAASLRIRMGESANIIALGRTWDGRVIATSRKIIITVGGCVNA